MVGQKMKIYKYRNYVEYVNAQKEAFNRKFKNIWAKEENIKIISDYMKTLIKIEIGLCHGVRQGLEVEWFIKNLNCDIFGTEIGGNCGKTNILHWDFNKENPNLINKFDFIYSNSFDHAFNPKETIKIWQKQLRNKGLIVLEYDRRQEHTGEISKSINKTDPVSLKFEELQILIPKWTGMKIVKILDMPIITNQWRKAIIYGTI